jgi:hypothetical protein
MKIQVMSILSLTFGVLTQFAGGADVGINFPPNQGTSNAGAFMPGVYNYTYTDAQIAACNGTFNMMRLPINVATANNPASLTQMQGYINQFSGHYAIICMFGTSSNGGQGNGFPNGLSAMGAAWKKINAVFSSYPNVHYEIFNEPFGYAKSDPTHYVSDMETIISDGGLPTSKCILDGMGYADDVNLVASGGWTGDLAYHFYPSWLSSGYTQSEYSNLAQAALGSWGQKTWVTEFGANLGWTSAYGYDNTCYDVYVDGNQPCSADVNCLRGLNDALSALKADGHGVKGAFLFHGWNNGDTYDYWATWNSCGACKELEIEQND